MHNAINNEGEYTHTRTRRKNIHGQTGPVEKYVEALPPDEIEALIQKKNRLEN